MPVQNGRSPVDGPNTKGTMKRLSETQAIEVIEDYHVRWSDADVSGMMKLCHQDVVLRLVNAAPDGGTLNFVGKQAITEFLAPISQVTICTNIPLHTRYSDGTARTQVDATVRHKRTGHILRGTYRQLVQFDGREILSFDEFHDMAMMRAFWEMVREDEAIFRGLDPTS